MCLHYGKFLTTDVRDKAMEKLYAIKYITFMTNLHMNIWNIGLTIKKNSLQLQEGSGCLENIDNCGSTFLYMEYSLHL